MAEYLVSPGIKITETDRSAIAPRPLVAGAALIGPTPKGPVNIPTKVSSYGDYQRRFGTSFMVESSSVMVEQEYLTSLAAKSYFEQGGETLLVVRVAKEDYTSAVSTQIDGASSGSIEDIFKLKTIGQGEIFNSNGNSGSVDNFKFEIFDVNPERGTFGLAIRRGDDTDNDKIILEQFLGLSLDPNSPDYIESRIGNQYATLKTDDEYPYVDIEGEYINKSAYVYVSAVNKPTLGYLKSDGYTINSDPSGVSYENYLPTEGVGYFENGSGTLSYESSLFDNIGEITQGLSGEDYDNAINLLRNQDEYEIDIISAPGLLVEYHKSQVDLLVDVAQSRGDCIAIIDLVNASASVADAKSSATSVNNSYAATYFPWLQIYSSTGKLEWVPASVVIPGLYEYNDNVSAPWFAPAGMTRGGIQGVVQAKKKLTKSQRDILYSSGVNPIATLPGAGIVAYGQKTLQKKASALDRVSVRRLLIELKKKVKDIASGLLFEQNSASTRNSFRAKLEPYLETIVQRQGLYSYRIVLDELNDADTIDRNEFRCQIFVQPTKTIEFVYIDFTITATGVDFS